MRLTVVGCTGSAPGPDSGCSCYLVESDETRLLLDLGSGSAGPLQRYAAPTDIDAVLLSHAHSDHWVDLTQLGYYRERAGKPLTVIGSSELPDVVWTNPDVFEATTSDSTVRQIGSMSVRQTRVEHGDLECWASRIDDALCYSADTQPCKAIEELADGCQVLLAEASGSDVDGPMRGHLTAGDAARLANRSGVRLLILTHVRAWHDRAALLEEAASIANCQVILATSGLRVAL